MSRLTPEQRRMRAQIAAYARWSKTTDRSAATRPAREAMEAKWAAEADPEGARREHYRRMAFASSKARKSA
jgi:hypothetical protein